MKCEFCKREIVPALIRSGKIEVFGYNNFCYPEKCVDKSKSDELSYLRKRIMELDKIVYQESKKIIYESEDKYGHTYYTCDGCENKAFASKVDISHRKDCLFIKLNISEMTTIWEDDSLSDKEKEDQSVALLKAKFGHNIEG